MRAKELQRISNRLEVQRELIADAERQYLQSYWQNEDDTEYLYKLWQQAVHEYNGMAVLCNVSFGLEIESLGTESGAL